MYTNKEYQVDDRVMFLPNMSIRMANYLEKICTQTCYWFINQMAGIRDAGTAGRVTSIDGNKYRVKFDDGQDFNCIKQWLIPAETGKSIAVSELHEIVDIACTGWKTKLEDMIPESSCDRVFIRGSFIQRMLDAATTEQRPVLERILIPESSKPIDLTDLKVTTVSAPLYIRRGHANGGFQDRELGFDNEYRAVLFHDGQEIELKSGINGAYIRLYRNG